MDKIKIIFFDVDGTLIDMEKKKISKKMLEALQRLQDRGIILCIATGRSPIALPRIGDGLFSAFLTFNGSYCFNEETVMYKHPIPTEDIATIVANSHQLGRPVAIATRDQTIANGKDADLVEYFAFAHQEVIVADDFERVMKEEEIFQVMLGGTSQEYDQIMRDTVDSKIVAWWDRAVDIIPATSGKGTGIAAMLDYYGFDKSEALAFGDGNNDIEMLQAVGWGVAMDNASPDLKAIADEVIGHVADDGIYHFCEEQGLI